MRSKLWGENVWEDKIKTQNEHGVVFGTNSTKKFMEKHTKKEMIILKEKFLNYIKKGGKVLDAGIGPAARFSIAFSKLGYKVTGVDISKTTLKYAKKHIDKEKLNIELVQDNLIELNKIKKGYDLIFCFGTFGHIPAYLSLEVLKSFNKKLNDNGYCLIEFWIEKETNFKKVFNDFKYGFLHNIKKMFKKTFPVNCSTYSPEEISDLTRRAGFEIVKKEQELYLLKKIN
jgi:2-polyprenyl-3-methyl-5-hydroxy-6-metoxy-1,4-benzoquinol methylase